MKNKDHPKHGSLIDFVEGDLPPEGAREVEAHLAACEACRTYAETLRSTFSALEADPLPEPPEAFFSYLAGRARHRASRGGRRLILKFIPGLASAAAVAVLMWWLGGTFVSPVDGVDVIMADMTTGQIVETVSGDPDAESLLVEDSEAGLREIETYLIETESIYDLLGNMSETEKARFMAYLEGSMAGDRGTSGLSTDSMRKEC